MRYLSLHKYILCTLFIAILTFIACDNTPKNETTVYFPDELNDIKKIALITFCAKEKVTMGEFSYGNFESKVVAMPELVQYVTNKYAIELHNTLLKEIDLVSLNSIKRNKYYQSLKDRYPLEYKVKRLFWHSSRKIVNALSDLTIYIPENETSTFAKLADSLNVDAILWVMCDYYLDIHKGSSLIRGSSGQWIGEVHTITKLFNSKSKLIWEASHFYKSSPKEGANDSWWKKLDTKQRIEGQTMVDLLLDASIGSINAVVMNLKAVLQ
jgi:hypothetical protein